MYSVVTRIDWPVTLEIAQQAYALVEGAFRSAPEDKIAAEVYRLRVLTRGREQRHESDREAEATIWIEKLRGYPGDIVVDVLQSWTSRPNGQWWPAWAEVERELRARASERQALANHIQSVIDSGGSPKPVAAIEAPPRWNPTVAELKELFGESWGIDQQHVETSADAAAMNLPTSAREKYFAGKAEEEAAAFRASPPKLSPGLLSKLESEGRLSSDPQNKAA